MHQRRAPCSCDTCEGDEEGPGGNPEECESKDNDSSLGVWWNKPHLQVLHAYMLTCINIHPHVTLTYTGV